MLGNGWNQIIAEKKMMPLDQVGNQLGRISSCPFAVYKSFVLPAQAISRTNYTTRGIRHTGYEQEPSNLTVRQQRLSEQGPWLVLTCANEISVEAGEGPHSF